MSTEQSAESVFDLEDIAHILYDALQGLARQDYGHLAKCDAAMRAYEACMQADRSGTHNDGKVSG